MKETLRKSEKAIDSLLNNNQGLTDTIVSEIFSQMLSLQNIKRQTLTKHQNSHNLASLRKINKSKSRERKAISLRY